MLGLPSCQFREIASFCTPKDLFASKRVCKRFSEEFSRPLIWNNIVQRYLPPVMSSFENSSEALLKSICNKDEPVEFILTCEKKDGEWKDLPLSALRIQLKENAAFSQQLPCKSWSWELEFCDTKRMSIEARAAKMEQYQIQIYCVFEKEGRLTSLRFDFDDSEGDMFLLHLKSNKRNGLNFWVSLPVDGSGFDQWELSIEKDMPGNSCDFGSERFLQKLLEMLK